MVKSGKPARPHGPFDPANRPTHIHKKIENSKISKIPAACHAFPFTVLRYDFLTHVFDTFVGLGDGAVIVADSLDFCCRKKVESAISIIASQSPNSASNILR